MLEYIGLMQPWGELLSWCIRLLLACLCGAAIGFERSKRFKEAGIRTHIIVCVGAALAMIISKYGFEDLGGILDGSRTSDPARVAAQVVTGISFLGAGVIFKNGGTIKGLTTAAVLWFTAASIGLAVGAGMIAIGIFATVLVTAVQILLHRYAVGSDAYAANRLQFTVKNGFEFTYERASFRCGFKFLPVLPTFGIGFDLKQLRLDLSGSFHNQLGYSIAIGVGSKF